MSYRIETDPTRNRSILCLLCGHRSYNTNDIEQKYCGCCHRFHLGHGATLEPDLPPRDTKHHKRIIGIAPLTGTRSGNMADLECGHRVMTFGRLEHAGGVVLCTQCRDADEA